MPNGKLNRFDPFKVGLALEPVLSRLIDWLLLKHISQPVKHPSDQVNRIHILIPRLADEGSA
jgi:hypothetical protein